VPIILCNVRRRGHCIKHHHDIIFALFFGIAFREAYRVSEGGLRKDAEENIWV
jgi:hypothetical protein